MKGKSIIMPLLDGGIVSIVYNADSISGCPTCDYGSSYIDDFRIQLTQYTIDVHINTMYDHLVSEEWLLRTLLGLSHNIAEAEFTRVLYEKLYECFQKRMPSRDVSADPDFYRVSSVGDKTVIEEKEFALSGVKG